VQTSSEVQRQG